MISFLSLRTDYVFCLQQRVTKPLNSIIHIFEYYVDVFEICTGCSERIVFFLVFCHLSLASSGLVEIVHSHYVLDLKGQSYILFYFDGY